MDVTRQILAHNNIYGASDYTGPHTLSASRSLNYVKGPSISRPDVENLNVIPFKFKYEDAVGLFGAENYFVKVNINLDKRFSQGCFEEEWYECAEITAAEEEDPFYASAEIDYAGDPVTLNTYEPAVINLAPPLPTIYDPWVSVSLENLKVNNIYIDDWLDVRLYTKDRKEHPSNFMYVRPNDFFYLGVHARNTRRLPYNIELTVGEELRSGLPSTECNDQWDIDNVGCACIEEDGWVCAEMHLYNETGTAYESAVVDKNLDPTTVNSYQTVRVFLQGTECISQDLANVLGIDNQANIEQIPPPKTHLQTMRKDHRSDPCCATCH